MFTDNQPILVGVDESATSRLAVAWAVADAATRGCGVRLLAVYSGRRNPDLSAERLVDGAIAYAREVDASVITTGEVKDGDPTVELIAQSQQASLTVLGSRQLKALGSSLHGSVGARVAARSPKPTIVLRTDDIGHFHDGAVVVGVDDSDGSESALAFGFDHAHRHHASLHAVMCWTATPPAASVWKEASQRPYIPMETWLGDLVRTWQQKYPDVKVEPIVAGQRSIPGLVEHSAGAQLLVVGSRARRATAATLLGSVSQGVLHHASCPVAVVPVG